ncbi:IS110 family transposase [Amaricoccus sp. W119]|uniref:IS110 family transposase n=1 Tax=Amaricoccus sp. W119 TaxID=3391833 RepID=UPI0039A57608
MIAFPPGAKVWLAGGATDMMGWTPPLARRQAVSLAIGRRNMSVSVIGVDIAKRVFQVHGVDAQGRTVLRRRLTRATFLAEMATHPPCLVGMDAGSGAHHWGRCLAELGHDVRLMPPQYVRPYVKGNKHDAADAEACCEAVQRPGMRFVPVKSEAQQATLMLHGVRDHFIRRRTGAINALRGHLAEFGLVSANQRAGLNQLLIAVEETGSTLPREVTDLLGMIAAEIRDYDRSIAELDKKLVAKCKEDDVSRRLRAMPGVGPVIATAMPAFLTAGGSFDRASSFAAWLGITPRQHSSGGKERTFGITKRGNTYLRKQLIHGARAVVRVARGRTGGIWDWINKMLERRHFNIVTVAVANKMARIMWSMVTKGTAYRAA